MLVVASFCFWGFVQVCRKWKRRPPTEMLSFCETKWVKFKFQANWSFHICIVVGVLMYWWNCFGMTFIEFRHAAFL